jgi:diguanylate cyclase (GGDEF)-like protein
MSGTDERHKADILVVDDTLDNLRLLSKLLMGHGYYVRPVPDGKKALSVIRDQPPDLILLDIMMPDMDGYEVCRRLQADEKTRNIPVIFISALNESFDKVKAFSIGGRDYITKPFHEEEVLARIKTHVTLHFTQKSLEAEIAERKRIEKQLEYHATTDALTDIANRRAGMLFLANQIYQSRRNRNALCICFADVDGLKRVNDTYGHEEGDELIRMVCQAMRETLRESDFVARLGGDEFLIVFPQCSIDLASEIWQRVEERLETLNRESGKPYRMSVSRGFAECSPDTTMTPDELILVADKEMYRHKQGNTLEG